MTPPGSPVVLGRRRRLGSAPSAPRQSRHPGRPRGTQQSGLYPPAAKNIVINYDSNGCSLFGKYCIIVGYQNASFGCESLLLKVDFFHTPQCEKMWASLIFIFPMNILRQFLVVVVSEICALDQCCSFLVFRPNGASTPVLLLRPGTWVWIVSLPAAIWGAGLLDARNWIGMVSIGCVHFFSEGGRGFRIHHRTTEHTGLQLGGQTTRR